MTAGDGTLVLELDGASIRLDQRIVFRRTTWVFRRGEHWVLVGPNGSGKTVLCQALCGEHPVVEGTVHYGFRPIAGREPEQCVEHLSFGRTVEAGSPAGSPARWFSLDQEESPRVSEILSRDRVENINPFEVVQRPPADVARWERHARRVIGWLGIKPLLSHAFLSLSNGEQRKVMLARALMRQPRLLILDDPLAGLDAGFRRHLREVFEALIRQRVVSLLWVGMRPGEWPHGMTHLMLIEHFRMVATGRVGLMRKDPRVVRLLGDSPTTLCGAGGDPPDLLQGRRGLSGGELIAFRKVRVRWGRVVILHDVDWTVREGESWAIIGPNGSGKSTLLSMILGENPQVYANEVRVFGKRRGTGESVWDIKQSIGWVSPEFHQGFEGAQEGLDAVLTGFHDATILREVPTARQRQAAMAWMRRLSIAPLARRPFGLLSTGEQRLVLLARALVKRPRLLILDEPCQGLDRRHRAIFVAVVDGLIRDGVTTLYVTHQRDDLPPSICRVLVLRNGHAHVQG